MQAAPGNGPKLHKHPYEEIFVMLEGHATFTVGDNTLEVDGGHVVIGPDGVAHKFVNSGEGTLRQITIHPSREVEKHFRRLGPVEGRGILHPVFWEGESVVVDDVHQDPCYVGVPRGHIPEVAATGALKAAITLRAFA